MKLFIALISGTLFGMGLAISGMADPSKVIGFLDIFGDWDPSLAFVMGGGLLVYLPVYFLIVKKQDKPVLAEEFNLPLKKSLDKKLISGAVIFGVGWGLAGFCPGPAISSLGSGNLMVVVFIIAMAFGMLLTAKATAANKS